MALSTVIQTGAGAAETVPVSEPLPDVAFSWRLHQAGRFADAARRIQDDGRLTDHRQSVLPRPVHQVCYERLVDDFGAEARQPIAACGLDWEPACLRFHETSRPVRTASVAQVGQPLYRNSLGRWKAYASFLSPLFDRLRAYGHSPDLDEILLVSRQPDLRSLAK